MSQVRCRIRAGSVGPVRRDESGSEIMANMNLVATALATSSTPHVPRFDGIFAALNVHTASWDVATWREDLDAMKTARMTFLVVPHTVRQIGPPTAACTSGTFETYFPLAINGGLPSSCFKQVGSSSSGGTIGNILAAANATGLSVHLGLAFEMEMDYQNKNVSTLELFAALQWQVAKQLWRVASAVALSHVVSGIYTEVEECNGAPWMSYMQRFATTYLQPLALNIKSLRSSLLVWSSPYAVANRTRYPVARYVLPSAYAGLWEQTLAAWAPALDVVALQDSTGALGNSFADVRELLGNVSAAVARQRRSAWTNVELFEVWPPSCEWPERCHGRHPASFARIRAQLENEAPLLRGPRPQIIAWEWGTCLSPTPGNGAAFPEANLANYKAYLAYIADGERPAGEYG